MLAGLEQHTSDSSLVHPFGDFELIEEIARGGMGVVYKARQISLDRILVVKMIHGGLFANKDSIQRFQYEARAASKLSHPNIVPIYDIGEFEGQHYFTMKYISGGTLADRMEAYGLYMVSPNTVVYAQRQERLVKMMITLAQAVHYAHQYGIIHRDLKPGNILLDDHGEPHVADFSLAKVVDEGYGLTMTGNILGTPGFMSPEQAKGNSRKVTTATDIYGLGAVMYVLLTGRVPFEGHSPSDVLLKIQSESPIKPAQVVSSIHPDLETICLHCLEKQEHQRYDSARELADELGRFLKGEPIRARPVSLIQRCVRWQQRNPLVASLAFLTTVLLVAGIVGVTWQRNKAINANEELTDLIYDLDRELVDARMEQGLPHEALRVLSRRLESDPNNHIAVNRAISILEQISIPLPDAPPVDLGASAWLMRLDVQNELAAVVIGDQKGSNRGGGTRAHAYSLPGPAERLRLWDVASGNVSSEPMTHDGLIHDVAFDRSGKRIVSASWDGTAKVWDVASKKLIRELPHKTAVWAARFNPAGDRLVTSCFDKQQKAVVSVWNVKDWERLHEIPLPNRSARWIDMGRDNRIFAIAAGRNAVREIATGNVLMNPGRHSDFLFTIHFNQDASKIVTASMDTTSRVFDVLTGKELTPPLRHTRAVHAARFSPNGLLIATVSNDRTAQIWDAETGQPLTSGLPHESSVIDVQFSGDGQKMVTVTENGVATVWDAFTGREITRLGAEVAGITGAFFDSTGLRLATVSKSGLAVRWDIAPNRTWPEPMPVELNKRNASFLPVGDKHYFIHPNHSGLLDVYPSDHSVVLERRKIHQSKIHGFEFSPDFSTILTASKDGTAKVWDAKNLDRIHTFKMEDSVASAHFDSKGDRIVTASEAGKIQIWEVLSGEKLTGPYFYDAQLSDVQFSQSGDRLIAAFDNGTVRILDAASGEVLRGPMKQAEPLLFANFLQENRYLYAIQTRGGMRLWDMERELPLGQAIEIPQSVTYSTVSADSSHLMLYPPQTSIYDHVTPYRVSIQTREEIAHPAFLEFLHRVAHRLDAFSREEYDSMVQKFWDMRKQWEKATDEDADSRWLRWAFSERVNRPIAPGTTMSTHRFLELSAALFTDNEILMRYLLEWMPRIPSTYYRLAGAMAARGSGQRTSIYHMTRHATELAPDDPDAWHARSRAASRLDRDFEAVACIQRALVLDPARQQFLHSRRYIHEKASRNKQVLNAEGLQEPHMNKIVTRIKNLNKPEYDSPSVSLTIAPGQPLRLETDKRVLVDLPYSMDFMSVEMPLPSITAPRPGNHALSFDGVDDYVQIGHLPMGEEDFTIEAWIKPDQSQRGTYQYLVTNRSFALGEGRGGIWFYFGINPHGQVCLGLSPSGHPYKATVNGRTVLDKDWHHVVAVRKGTTLFIYLNGKLDGKLEHVTKRKIANKQPDGRIGGYPDFDRYYFDGCIDEVRMWTTARSQEQIKTFSRQKLSGTEKDLLAYYPFDHGVAGAANAGATLLEDLSPNALHGTLRVTALVDGDSNWVAGVPEFGGAITVINDRTDSADASALFPEGSTTVAWTVTGSDGKKASSDSEIVVHRK